MKRLYLADLKGLTEYEVKKHIVERYNDGEPSKLTSMLGNYAVLVAYESVGSWGCDSASWFLLRDTRDNSLWEVSGSHCSCYGFEGQFEPAEAPLEHLQSEKFYMGTGGYDNECDTNVAEVKAYLAKLE